MRILQGGVAAALALWGSLASLTVSDTAAGVDRGRPDPAPPGRPRPRGRVGVTTSNRRAPVPEPAAMSRQVRRQAERLARKGRTL